MPVASTAGAKQPSAPAFQEPQGVRHDPPPPENRGAEHGARAPPYGVYGTYNHSGNYGDRPRPASLPAEGVPTAPPLAAHPPLQAYVIDGRPFWGYIVGTRDVRGHQTTTYCEVLPDGQQRYILVTHRSRDESLDGVEACLWGCLGACAFCMCCDWWF